ncbi:PREDICTED: testis-expressed sequence 264 protein-like [Branchiostoma belcheri]|uniref:Testis-expressed sequence 264 protein-like n=1 Tax=Branchiostoma belcheri TaxID=7741 RepID=A0A6P4YQJ0_BRABE|nr:PREDICTED: testis-expressed sequence 264 protein-like [Branchiostoma belcheri]
MADDQTMIILIAIAALLLLLALTIFFFLVQCGLFHTVDVRAGTPPIENVTVMYKYRQGPYKDAGDFFTDTIELAPTKRTFGVYYDDPKQVEAEECRYIVGCIVSEGKEAADKGLMDQMKAEGYRSFRFPAVTHAVKTEFPFANHVSILIATTRVYPQLAAYIKEHHLCAHPCLEIYDENYIHFMAPLAKQIQFYVPEVRSGSPTLSLAETTSPEDSQSDGEGDTSYMSGDTSYNTTLDSRDFSTQDIREEMGKGEGSEESSFEELEVEEDMKE